MLKYYCNDGKIDFTRFSILKFKIKVATTFRYWSYRKALVSVSALAQNRLSTVTTLKCYYSVNII